MHQKNAETQLNKGNKMTQILNNSSEPEKAFIFIRTPEDVNRLKYYYREKPEYPGVKFSITKAEAHKIITQEVEFTDLYDGLEIAVNHGFLCDNDHVIYASTK